MSPIYQNQYDFVEVNTFDAGIGTPYPQRRNQLLLLF